MTSSHVHFERGVRHAFAILQAQRAGLTVLADLLRRQATAARESAAVLDVAFARRASVMEDIPVTAWWGG